MMVKRRKEDETQALSAYDRLAQVRGRRYLRSVAPRAMHFSGIGQRLQDLWMDHAECWRKDNATE